MQVRLQPTAGFGRDMSSVWKDERVSKNTWRVLISLKSCVDGPLDLVIKLLHNRVPKRLDIHEDNSSYSSVSIDPLVIAQHNQHICCGDTWKYFICNERLTQREPATPLQEVLLAALFPGMSSIFMIPASPQVSCVFGGNSAAIP